MTATKLYTDRSNCRRNAKKVLGHTQIEVVKTDDGMFYWIDISEAAAEAAGAENDPSSTYTAPEPEVSDLFTVAEHYAPAEITLPEAAEPELLAEAALAPTQHSEGAMAFDKGFAEAILAHEEPGDEEPEEPKANLTVDLGITPEIAELIYGLGDAAGEAIPVPKKRRGLTSAAWEAAERGELPPMPDFPASNAYAAKHAAALQGLAKERNSEALEQYQIGGTNTYSKALRDYRQALLAYLTSAATQMQEAA